VGGGDSPGAHANGAQSATREPMRKTSIYIFDRIM
jgi:hypothetical protein